jgi:peptidoglycan/LPS O-acetylase OafA/YrhL
LKKYAFIDALRGLAILGVLVYHASIHVPGVDERVMAILRNGHHGVQLFFIVSALTMFLSLGSRSARESRPIRNFFIRRVFRIVPLFYAGALFYFWYDRLAQGDLGSAQSSIGCILATLTFTNGWAVDWINRLVPGGWSIAVEMNFYLLVPWLFSRFRSGQQAMTAAFIALIAGGAASGVAKKLLTHTLGTGSADAVARFTWYWLPAQIPMFLSGVALYFLLRPLLESRSAETQASRPSPWLLLALAIYLIAAQSYSQTSLYLEQGLFAVAVLLLAWSLAIRPNLLVVNRATCYLGVVSYSAYLSHFLMLDLTDRLFRNFPAESFHPLSPLPRLVAFIAVTLAGTVLISTITYRTIELPAQSLGKRLIKHLESRQPAEAIAVEAC